MIIARLEYPNVKDTDKALVADGTMPAGKQYQGKHTIAAWGYRLGEKKGDYAAIKEVEAKANGIVDPEEIIRFVWGSWSQEMHDYMLQDCDTNLALWRHLSPDSYSQAAIELEHRIANVCNHMERAGVPFDGDAAGKLHAEIAQRRSEIERDLTAKFGFWYAPVSPDLNKSVFTPKNTSKTSVFHSWDENDHPVWKGSGYTEGCPVTKLKLVQFNPSSNDHIAKVLINKGWKPTEFTPGGKPEINEETIEAIVARFPEFTGLGEYKMLDKRLGYLATGKKALLSYVKDDGCIHGVINPMGTTTSRAAHMWPNLGQVPNASSIYGPEFRALFHTLPGWVIVGADQQGLELRGLAHYLFPLDGGKYSKVVLEGDPHWLHAQVMGLVDGERDKHNKLHVIVREDGSKRFIYAYIYGCYEKMAGEIIYTCLLKCLRDCGVEGKKVYLKFFGSEDFPDEEKLRNVGRKVRNAFASRIDGFKRLKDKIGSCARENHWVPGLDGRRIPIRSEHSALNFMIQSAGAIICKRWVCDAWDQLQAEGLKYDYENPWDGEFVFGLWVHDEIQVWCREGVKETVARILKETAAKAGEPYGFRVRLDGEAKIGRTWRETH